MKINFPKIFLGISVIAILYAILWRIWIGDGLLFDSLCLGGLGALILGFITGPNAETALATANATALESRPPFLFPGSWRLAGAGAVMTGFFVWNAFHDEWEAAAFWALFAVLFWRPILQGEETGRKFKGLWLALLLVFVAGAALRLYKIGEVPVPMAEVDEPRLMIQSEIILHGARPSFATEWGMSDGALPFYMQALSMKLFGQSILGFRLEDALVGIFLILLLYAFASELEGPRLGLTAAAFLALSYWPLSISREQYLMNESHMVVLLCFICLFRALKKESTAYYILAGLCFGLCFSSYKAAQIMLGLVPLYVVLNLLWRPGKRLSIWRGTLPFLGAALISLSPLLLWAYSNPALAKFHYFSSVTYSVVNDIGAGTNQSFWSRLDGSFGKVYADFPLLVQFFTHHGPFYNWYFVPGQPVIEKITAALFCIGLIVCLVRFRNPGFALLVIWWFLGLVPSLIAEPALMFDDRRIMMCMMPTMTVAALGLLQGMDLGRRYRMAWVAGGLAFLFFVYLFLNTTKAYFVDLQNNPDFNVKNRTNIFTLLRALREENSKHPLAIVSTRRNNEESWNAPFDSSYRDEDAAIIPDISRNFVAGDPDYFKNGGLFGVLGRMANPVNADDPPDIMVVLTPFHFYLEPMLIKMGGELVREIPDAQGEKGPSYEDVGMASEGNISAKLIRLRDLHPSALDAIRERYNFPISLQGLEAPRSFGSRGVVSGADCFSKFYLDAIRNYDANPAGWHRLAPKVFSLPDVYFWTITSNLPYDVGFPYRMSGTWSLDIPATGKYRFGANTTAYTAIRIDGKRVFSFIQEKAEQNDDAQKGLLGDEIDLSQGRHKISWEVLRLSNKGNFNQLLRLLWQTPNGSKETLPLENLYPEAQTRP